MRTARHRRQRRGAIKGGMDSKPGVRAGQARYWCEAFAFASEYGRFYPLGTYATATPRLALRWLDTRTQHIAEQLDPPASQALQRWLRQRSQHEWALTMLRNGRPYTYSFVSDGTHYHLSAHPIPDVQTP